KPIGIEQAQPCKMAGNAQLLRSRRKQQQVRCIITERFNEQILRTRRFRRPCEMMRFVHDDHIPSCRFRLVGPMVVLHKEAETAQHKLIVKKWIVEFTGALYGSASLLIENVEPQIETPQQFDKPLVNQ